MDKVMTVWLIGCNVFVLRGLVRCHLTTSTTSFNATSITSVTTSSTTTLENTSTPSLITSIDQSKDENVKRFYVSSPKQDSFSLHFKLSTDQVYFLDYNVSSLCSKQIRNISEGIQRGDHWALAFLDSNGQQSLFQTTNRVKLLGSYEQCEMVTVTGIDNDVISGKYIMMEFSPSLASFVPIDQHIQWYFCVPTSCTNDDYKNMETKFKETFDFNHVIMTTLRQDDPPKDYWYWAAIVTLSTLAFICVLATGIDCLYSNCLSQPSLDEQISIKQQKEEGILRLVTKEDDAMKGNLFLHRLNKCNGILQAFSLRRNLSDILKTSSSEGDIGCLHGLRALSMMWVIFGHVGNTVTGPREQRQLDRVNQGNFLIIAYSSPYAVDSFFLLSGFLVSYLFIKSVKKVGHLKCSHMVMYYIQRYIRLTPLFLVTMIIYAGILPYLLQGTYAEMFKYGCNKYWWRNVLYMNNLFPHREICISWSWYLSADMQFYVIAPIVTVPIVYGFYTVGVLMSSMMLTCHIAATAYVLEVVRDSKTSKHFNYLDDFYTKPWNRLGPYAIGLMLGFFLSCRQTELKINKLMLVLGWLTCTVVGLALVLSENYHTKVDADVVPDLSTIKLRLREIVKSPVWAICVTWVILVCHFGYGGLLNTFLTWRAWIPLSKLTYGTYLCHKMFILYFILAVNFGPEINKFYYIERFISVTVLTNIISLILSLLIEIPTRNLLKNFQKSSDDSQNRKLDKKEGVKSSFKELKK